MGASGLDAAKSVRALGRAAALLDGPVEGVAAEAGDRRWAAGLLHDLVLWGLARGVPDDALRPVEARLGQIAAELMAEDPVLGTLIDWWLTAVVGLPPQQLWHVQPLPEELAEALLPGGWPPNLGAEVKQRRLTEDVARLAHLAATVPVLSQVAKAQALVRDFNAELKEVLSGFEAGTPRPPDMELGRRLAERAETLLRGSGIIEGTPLYVKVRRELGERAALAGDIAARAKDLGHPVEPLPAARVEALTRLAKTGDTTLAGRLLAALGGPPPRPEPSGLAVALAEMVAVLGPEDRFRAHRLLGGVSEPVAAAAGDPELAAFVEEGRLAAAEILAALEGFEPQAASEAVDVPGLVRLALDGGELAEARGWLSDLSASVGRDRARREATRALDRARNRGVEHELVDGLAAALAAGDTEAMSAVAGQVRLLPGMDRKVSALAESAPAVPATGERTTLSGIAVLGATPGPGDGRRSVARGWPERLEQPAVLKATAAFVVRVNAHNRFFDGRICAAPAGNRHCASSERFKLDFCEKGIRRCSWLGAFADQPRVELTDPFIEEYQLVLDESPPAAGDVAVLWAATEGGNELVGLWRVLTLAPARRGWVLNGDRDAAVLLPRGIVPWSAIYRRWSSPRGSMAFRTLDTPGLEGLLVEVRDALAPLAGEDPAIQRDLAALEVMLADQRGRVPEGPRPAADTPATVVTLGPPPEGSGVPRPGAGSGRGRRDRRKQPVADADIADIADTLTANGQASAAPSLHERLRARGGFYPTQLVAQYELALAESRLVILAGPSGTGKTRLALEVAAEMGIVSCLVAVRPDWHANEDLLGYLPPFPGARFSSTPASVFIREAAVEAQAAAAEGRPARPFHLCLDEMNLARPEHYLAELLSKMEVPGGRVAFHTGGEEAGFPTDVPYPTNLVVIGTVNLDETTLPISAKILDRAAYLVVEAHELRAFLEALPDASEVPAWIPKLLVDLDGSLDDAGQGLGYRVAQRLVRWAVLGATRGLAPEETLDWALAAQVVPRLRFTRSDPSHLEVLEALVGRLRGAQGEFPRSVALLERMLGELRRQDFTLGQMRLS